MEKNIERLKIREAKVEDINDIMCLYGKTIWKIEQEFDNNLKKGFEQSKELYEIMTNDINDKNTIILIAELEKNLIGYISVSIISLEDAYIEKIAVLHEIAVEEEYQELGIGKSLLDSCIKILKEAKVGYIKLSMFKENIKANNFYKKNGFQPYSVNYIKKI